MRAHDTGERIAIRDCQRREALQLRFRHQFMRMRATTQKREVGSYLQLGIGRFHGINPCMNQRGMPVEGSSL